MNWVGLERWEKVVRLAAVASKDRHAATAGVRDAFGEAGGWITDVHFFSGVQTTFEFEIAPERLRALEEALARAGLALDVASTAALARAASSQEEVHGTLAVIFAHGDPDLKHDVPAVPR